MDRVGVQRKIDVKASASATTTKERHVGKSSRTKSAHTRSKPKDEKNPPEVENAGPPPDPMQRAQEPGLVDLYAPWNRPPDHIDFVELQIAQHIISTATSKLRYLLPQNIVGEVLARKKQRTEMSKDGVDSGILRDVLLLEFRGRKRSDKSAPLTEEDVRVKVALEKLFYDTIAWELDEETATIGMQTFDLLMEVLGYLPHAYEQSVRALEESMKQWQQCHDQEQRAEYFSVNQQTEGEKELHETSIWMDEQKKKLEAFIYDMQHELKLADRECCDIEARATVEMEYIEDCSQLSNEFEYWSMEKAEKDLAKEEARHKATHYSLPQMAENVKDNYERLLSDIQRREALLREKDRASHQSLSAQLAHAKQEVAKIESEIYESHVRTNDMQQEVLEWRRACAEEKAQMEALTRMVNAAIRIQRWWKWTNWKREKFGKKRKKKGKKGRKGKKGAKAAKKGKAKPKKK